MTQLRINVADLLHRPGARRALHLESAVPDFEGAAARVDAADPMTIDVVLEHVSDGIVVHGRVQGTWRSNCSRCLRDIANEFALAVRELFEPNPLDGETYPLGDETVDLEAVLRDTVLLELPVAPLCRDDCAGICPSCGIDRNESRCSCVTHELDPRWAALQDLQL